MSDNIRIVSAKVLSSLFFLASLIGCSDPDSPITPSPIPEASSAESSPSTDGDWKIKSATMAGTALPSSATDTITLKLSSENYVATIDGAPDKGTCDVDRKATPNQMTIKGTEGTNAGKTFLAIFDFPDTSTMRICYDLTGTAFPVSFTSTAENHFYLVTYVRQQ